MSKLHKSAKKGGTKTSEKDALVQRKIEDLKTEAAKQNMAAQALGDVKTGSPPTAKKTLHPVNKTKPASEEKKTEETSPENEETALQRPPMPEGFCLQSQEEWDGNGVCFDLESNGCKECLKDESTKETALVCQARAEYLAVLLKTPKSKKEKGARAPRVSGRKPQSEIIDDFLKEKKTTKEMIDLLAAEFGGDTKKADKRIASHIKAIQTGTYCRAEQMKSYVVQTTPSAV